MPDRLISEAVEAISTERGQVFKGNRHPRRYCRVWIVYADEILRYVHEGWIFYEEKKGRNESGTESCGNNAESFNHLVFWRTIDTNVFKFNRIETIVVREETWKLWNFEKFFDWLILKWSRIETCESIFR